MSKHGATCRSDRCFLFLLCIVMILLTLSFIDTAQGASIKKKKHNSSVNMVDKRRNRMPEVDHQELGRNSSSKKYKKQSQESSQVDHRSIAAKKNKKKKGHKGISSIIKQDMQIVGAKALEVDTLSDLNQIKTSDSSISTSKQEVLKQKYETQTMIIVLSVLGSILLILVVIGIVSVVACIIRRKNAQAQRPYDRFAAGFPTNDSSSANCCSNLWHKILCCGKKKQDDDYYYDDESSSSSTDWSPEFRPNGIFQKLLERTC